MTVTPETLLVRRISSKRGLVAIYFGPHSLFNVFKILGRPLSEVWDRLCLKSRMTVVQQLAHIQAQLYNTSFPKIGSLYEDNPHRESPFYVGRSAPPVQLERNRIDRGPWLTSREQLRAMMEEQIDEIQNNETTLWSTRRRSCIDNSVFNIEHYKMLYSALLHFVNKAKLFDMWEPSYTLSHPDLTLHNILVGYDDPTCILALVDWEGARIQPPVTASPLIAYAS
jgi:Phosphotransferase enzyme family